MSDLKISQLPAAVTVADANVIPIVQDSTTMQATRALFLNGAAIDNAVINGSTIGATTPAAGTFLAVVGTTGTFSGAITGSSVAATTAAITTATITTGNITTANATNLNVNSKALTLAGAFTTAGAYALTLTATGTTNVTLPTSGTLGTVTATTTYTPTVTLSGGSGNVVPVYSTNIGRWARAGNIAVVQVYLNGDGGAEGAGTGELNIALPTASEATTSSLQCAAIGWGLNGSTYYYLHGLIDAQASVIRLRYRTDFSSAPAAFSGAEQSNSTRQISICFTYLVP